MKPIYKDLSLFDIVIMYLIVVFRIKFWKIFREQTEFYVNLLSETNFNWIEKLYLLSQNQKLALKLVKFDQADNLNSESFNSST